MENKPEEYQELEKFVGNWNTIGLIPATKESPEISVKGSDSYEWLPGQFFLLHKVDVLVGNDRNETLEVIGYDKHAGYYILQHYDNKGHSGRMTGTLSDGVWTFLGDTLRFRGGFKNNNKEFSGTWEQLNDGRKWVHFMDIILRKTN